jgi:hypothetical protein
VTEEECGHCEFWEPNGAPELMERGTTFVE